MDTLYNDNINELIKYLSQKDIYHLSLSCKKFKDLFRLQVLTNINNKCKKLFGNDYQQFKTLIKTTHSVVSGGFVLEAILNEHYHSVVTIYCLSDYQYLLNHFFNKLFGWYSTEISIYSHVKSIKTYYTKYDYMSQDCVKIIEINHKSLIFNKNYIINFIKNVNDMNICKNLYYIDDQEHCLINNIDHMLNKNIIVEKNPFYHMTDYQYYKTCGFNLDITNLYVDLTKYKIKLYTQRPVGDNICNHVGPIGECSHQYNPCVEHDNCVLEQCDSLCIIHFLDANVKHYHFKMYNYTHDFEIIIIL